MKKIKYHPTSKYAVRVLTVLIILFFNSLNANPSNCETEVFKIDQKFLSSNFWLKLFSPEPELKVPFLL